MSEISVPITVSTLSIRISEPARYMSCEMRAPSISGPTMGRFSTTATMVVPEASPASDQPTVPKGFRARALSAEQGQFLCPLARAVTTQGFSSSSSRLARMVRISSAAPPVPKTTSRIQMCARRSRTLSHDQAASAYSGEKSADALAEHAVGEHHEHQGQEEAGGHAEEAEGRGDIVAEEYWRTAE